MNALVSIEPTRYTIFSPQARAKFLDHLSINGNVRLACKVAGVSSQTAYRARRKHPELAQLWDAALVSARSHAEDVLANRALDGTEETVFYHGEEVATRIRYDSRLLLAHLARLDRMAERADVTATLPVFDEAIAALEEGREVADILPQDSAPCAPSRRISAQEKEAQEQAEREASWAYDERVRLMERARPEDAPLIEEMNDDPGYDLEVVQLEAFEEGLDEWWTIRDEYELDERLEARDLALEGNEETEC
ncbi:hypothetical protein [Altererythrobacter sp. MF3-039]|uniref:hypothetical protein n=1 Tax=Altererythrobacter sp. MF3-039 TaxID=3252901 RepID=UPI00390CAFE8